MIGGHPPPPLLVPGGGGGGFLPPPPGFPQLGPAAGAGSMFPGFGPLSFGSPLTHLAAVSSASMVAAGGPPGYQQFGLPFPGMRRKFLFSLKDFITRVHRRVCSVAE